MAPAIWPKLKLTRSVNLGVPKVRSRLTGGMGAVFVTVGTTQFDVLIQKLLSDEALALLASQGYRSLVLQIGRGAEPPAVQNPPLAVDW